MACLSHECRNPKCQWADFTNRECDHCPLCGSDVHTMFDEPEGWDDYEQNEPEEDDDE